MSQRDYIAIAEVIRNEHQRAFRTLPAEGSVDLFGDYKLVGGAIQRIADGIAAHCKQDNPRFDTERFMTACGF